MQLGGPPPIPSTNERRDDWPALRAAIATFALSVIGPLCGLLLGFVGYDHSPPALWIPLTIIPLMIAVSAPLLMISLTLLTAFHVTTALIMGSWSFRLRLAASLVVTAWTWLGLVLSLGR